MDTPHNFGIHCTQHGHLYNYEMPASLKVQLELQPPALPSIVFPMKTCHHYKAATPISKENMFLADLCQYYQYMAAEVNSGLNSTISDFQALTLAYQEVLQETVTYQSEHKHKRSLKHIMAKAAKGLVKTGFKFALGQGLASVIDLIGSSEQRSAVTHLGNSLVTLNRKLEFQEKEMSKLESMVGDLRAQNLLTLRIQHMDREITFLMFSIMSYLQRLSVLATQNTVDTQSVLDHHIPISFYKAILSDGIYQDFLLQLEGKGLFTDVRHPMEFLQQKPLLASINSKYLVLEFFVPVSTVPHTTKLDLYQCKGISVPQQLTAMTNDWSFISLDNQGIIAISQDQQYFTMPIVDLCHQEMSNFLCFDNQVLFNAIHGHCLYSLVTRQHDKILDTCQFQYFQAPEKDVQVLPINTSHYLLATNLQQDAYIQCGSFPTKIDHCTFCYIGLGCGCSFLVEGKKIQNKAIECFIYQLPGPYQITNIINGFTQALGHYIHYQNYDQLLSVEENLNSGFVYSMNDFSQEGGHLYLSPGERDLATLEIDDFNKNGSLLWMIVVPIIVLVCLVPLFLYGSYTSQKIRSFLQAVKLVAVSDNQLSPDNSIEQPS